MTTVLNLGVGLATQLLGARIPAEVTARVASDHAATLLATKAVKALKDGASDTPGPIETTRYLWEALPSLTNRMRLAFGVTIAATEAEYKAVPLPPALYWLYGLVRPVRLLAKYALKRSLWGTSRAGALLSPSSRLRIPTHVVASRLHDETVLLNLQTETYYGLDPVGSKIWEAIVADVVMHRVCDSLMAHYAVDEHTVRGDVEQLVSSLVERGLIEVA